MLANTLYDPRFEHDACGAGFVAQRNGERSHRVVQLALCAVERLAHRGAIDERGGEPTGDGAGLLTQLPIPLLRRELRERGIDPDTTGTLAVAMCFLPAENPAAAADAEALVERELTRRGAQLLFWRDVPTVPEAIGATARETQPLIRQLVMSMPQPLADAAVIERRLYDARRAIEHELHRAAIEGCYIASLSCRTIVYKGLLVSSQLARFYPDLCSPLFASAIAVFHQRYSTNTFPNWERAQPFRMLCHNGEINTLQGNVNWMRAREADLVSADLEPESLRDVVDATGSDSSMLDNVLELLVRGGRTAPHAMAMLVPPAWEHDPLVEQPIRDFCDFHAGAIEPWDGPAALSFSDGTSAGALLDRNGLRPARYLITDDGIVACSSEVGTFDLPDHAIVRRGKLGPGQMVVVDTCTGEVLRDGYARRKLAARAPYGEWLNDQRIDLEHDLAERAAAAMQATCTSADLAPLQAAFGYTREELTVVLRPMARTGHEPVGSMGDDTPHAALSATPRPLFNYFKQRFAEVTNPPIDPIRERSVMSMSTLLGPRANMLDLSPVHARLLRVARPVIEEGELVALCDLAAEHGMPVREVPTWALLDDGRLDLAAAVDAVCRAAEHAVESGASIIVLSDRGVDERHAPIPSLLAISAVHHHLIRRGLRMRASLIVDSGEPRDVHHVATLIGFGANIVCPWLALRSAATIVGERARRGDADVERSPGGEDPEAHARAQLLDALDGALRKVLSKMGISTIDSYCGAQVFEAFGLQPVLVERCFAGTPLRPGATGIEAIAEQVVAAHCAAFPGDGKAQLHSPGFYKFKRDGEHHAFNPKMVKAMHLAVLTRGTLTDNFDEGYQRYREFSALVAAQPPTEPRDLLGLRVETPAAQLPLDQVEPIDAIVRRFSTGAMSHGSLSSEAHETLAIALNRLGGMSNSGEGGEHHSRFGTERNSAIKQVASARFGVTPAYLQSARELQIKMAQGSKPGEGGQLPGHKVTEEIAAIRNTVPGVSLISPPPHHDIYSIEDLAQLIFDLRAANPRASVSVKLVGQAGVGTIAAGVAKAHADVILISGHCGGTGASPLSSIKNAGAAWEVGLAETQQTLLANNLRGRVRLRVDGGMRTGRDIVIAALLGADEYSFGTAALIAEGCVMARTCHNNQCPVGIATQRRDLRDQFPGDPERVMAYLRFVAQEVRELLAALGLRSLEQAVGRSDLLEQALPGPIDLGPLLAQPTVPTDWVRRGQHSPQQGRAAAIPQPEASLNERIVVEAWPAVALGARLPAPIIRQYAIANSDRTVGATLAGEIARRHGDAGLPDGSVQLGFTGSAGQSFGAFLTAGIRLRLEGEANDYVGKGMAGGQIAISLPPNPHVAPELRRDYAVGNTVLYGATGGSLFVAGMAGERFAVRNSGALAVVEGVGDHACEYMTGGLVVVLGEVGRNFGAGMTGGVAYVLDELGELAASCNAELPAPSRVGDSEQLIVRELVERHLRATGSPRAGWLLDNWAVAVVPHLRCVGPAAEPVAEPAGDVGAGAAAEPAAR